MGLCRGHRLAVGRIAMGDPAHRRFLDLDMTALHLVYDISKTKCSKNPWQITINNSKAAVLVRKSNYLYSAHSAVGL